MSYVYLLLKHPPYPYRSQGQYLEVATVVGAYASKDEPSRIAAEKNGRNGRCYHYSVQRKAVKP